MNTTPSLRRVFVAAVAGSLLVGCSTVSSDHTRATATYRRIKAALDAVPAIDTHEHLRPFEQLPNRVRLEGGAGTSLGLWSIWASSYYLWTQPLTPWQEGQGFDAWWASAKDDFQNARATSFYRSVLPAFQDLYGVDFEKLTDRQARELNDRIIANNRDPAWMHHVISERANIELFFNDPFWARFKFTTAYTNEVLVFNVTTLLHGFHPAQFNNEWHDPYVFARQEGLAVNSLDDYLVVVERLFQKAKAAGAACLKTTVAYERTLDFHKVSAERGAKAFGRTWDEITAAERKDFEDFIMWRLVELSAKYELPFQFHTGYARIQGSNPLLLADLIGANPRTKFILLHGGFPWISETAVIAMRYPKQVWIDSVWLPTLNYTMAKRALHEWLDAMPSDRIIWGGDAKNGEGVYGATEFMRRCLAEVLAEKVDAGDLKDEHALRIGRQILRENALALFPQLRLRLWKQGGKAPPPKASRP